MLGRASFGKEVVHAGLGPHLEVPLEARKQGRGRGLLGFRRATGVHQSDAGLQQPQISSRATT